MFTVIGDHHDEAVSHCSAKNLRRRGTSSRFLKPQHFEVYGTHVSTAPKHTNSLNFGKFLWHFRRQVGYNCRLVPAQDGHFFYTRSRLSALKNCALLFSTNFQFIFIFKESITQFSHWIVSCTFFSKILHSYLLNSRTVL